MNNPFFYGNPALPHQFINRSRELRRLVSRIISHGQSTAIVGAPRSGKTSLLSYLSAPETRTALYGEHGAQLVFSDLDAHTFDGKFSQAQFWERVLLPLYERAIAPDLDTSLGKAYQVCQENDFGAFVLERLLAQVRQANWRLVLMLDEFDVLLHHPILNSAEFFGSLRSLASRSRGALVLIIASRQPLSRLNKATQQFSCDSSPYFNFLDEVILQSWPKKAVTELLDRAQDRFSLSDRLFIGKIAGGHPCLLQVAAYELWEIYAEGEHDPALRQQQVGHNLYDKAALILSDTWQIWSPTTQRAFAAVALDHFPSLLNQREFHVKNLVRDIRDFGPELRLLERQGFVSKDKSISGGWRVRPSVFLWWMADELVRIMHDDLSLKESLQKQERVWKGLLTRGEKPKKAIRAMTNFLFNVGVTELIRIAVRGAVGV
jgi:hypothetical protein